MVKQLVRTDCDALDIVCIEGLTDSGWQYVHVYRPGFNHYICRVHPTREWRKQAERSDVLRQYIYVYIYVYMYVYIYVRCAEYLIIYHA